MTEHAHADGHGHGHAPEEPQPGNALAGAGLALGVGAIILGLLGALRLDEALLVIASIAGGAGIVLALAGFARTAMGGRSARGGLVAIVLGVVAIALWLTERAHL